jgi:ABC-type Fe3+ transport system substrate-binding protein
MLDLGLLSVILGKELSSPEGKKEVIRYLTSPEGMAILEEFFKSPDTRPLAGNLLMPVLGSLGVPDPVRQSMQQYIPK